MNATTSLLREMNTNLSNSSTGDIRFLSLDQINQLYPRIFAEGPTNPGLSPKYTFASSIPVIEDAAKLNFFPVRVAGPKHRSKVGSFHSVTFQNPDLYIPKRDENGEVVLDEEGKEVVKYFPRVILTNSYDGFCSFQFRAALYNPETGAEYIMGARTLNAFSLRHIHYTFEEFRELVNKITGMVPEQEAIISKMESRILTIDEQRELALASLRSRRNDPELICSNMILDDIITYDEVPADANLWIVFTTIHGKMMTGDFTIEGKRGPRKARKIKSVWKSIHMNEFLFKAAMELL